MIKDKVLTLIKEHRQEFHRFRVRAIYLFGSIARDDENPQSDIDILVAFEGPATFDQYMDLKFYLEDLFHRKVDLITESGLRPELRKYVERDLIRAA